MSGIGLDLNDVLKREEEAEQLALGRERQRGRAELNRPALSCVFMTCRLCRSQSAFAHGLPRILCRGRTSTSMGPHYGPVE